MSGSWKADRWPGTIFLSQGCFQMSQVCGLWSDDGQSRSNRAADQRARHRGWFNGRLGRIAAAELTTPLICKRCRDSPTLSP
jgi:hypothetical protein